MDASDGRLPAEQMYIEPSTRWFGYLLIAVIGSSVGGLILTLIWAFWRAYSGGINAATEAIIIGGLIAVVVIPVYVLLSIAFGLYAAKGYARDIHAIQMVTDGALVDCVHRTARQAGLPVMPEVGVYRSPDMNAFATGSGRYNSLIAFSTALLDKFTDDEAYAVAAHEVGHIANNDMLAMTVVNSIQNAMSWYMGIRELRALVRWLVFFVGETAAFVLSHRREFRADAVSAALVGKEKMIAALRKLEADQAVPPRVQHGYARLKVRDSLFSTHPPISARIVALDSGTYAHTVKWKRRPAPAFAGETSMG